MGFGILCMLGVVALWSFVPVLVKLLFPVFDPLTISFLRSAQGAAFVLALFFLRGHRLRDIEWSRWHIIGGLSISVNYSFYALSLSYTTASAGVLIVQVQYVTLAVLAAFVLHERLGLAKVAGIGLVLAGVAVVVGMRTDISDLLAPRYRLGNALMLLSGLGWGVYALANKALAHRAETPAILFPMMGISALVTGVLAAPQFELRSPPTVETLAAVLVVGVLGTGLSFTLVSEGMKRLSAALAGTITTATPIAQIALAHWILQEPVTWNLAGGGALILAGVFGMVCAERSQTENEPN